MKILGILLALFAALLAPDPARAVEPDALTLQQAYELALNQSETLKQRTEEIRAAKARYDEVIASLYPNVHLLASQRFRNSQSAGGSPGTGEINNNTGSVRSFSKHPFETSIFVRQPIFTGFREYYLAAATEGEIKALGYDQARNKQLLYQDVADVFNQVAYYSDDLKILQKTQAVFRKRIEELRQFIKLGKSRESEIDATESDVADLGATQERVSGLLGASKELLAFLVGREAQSIRLSPDKELDIATPLDIALTEARERSDVKAEQERALAATQEITAAERERWPVLNLDGNYYSYEDPDTGRDWDIVFRFDLPLYEGGAIDARVEANRAKARSAQLEAQRTARVADREVRIAHNNVMAAKAGLERLETLVQTTRKSYEAQHRDYELGVVTNLEVLSAIRSIQEAERRLLEAQTLLRTSLVKLRVASGGI